MKIKPVKQKVVIFDSDETLETLIGCCDSYIAVLTSDQVDEWLDQFESHVDQEYTDFGSATLVFDIDNQLFVAVCDSGGEGASGEFYSFCEERGIETQFVIDSLDCEGVEIEDIYTGEYDNNMELLGLLHKVFN